MREKERDKSLSAGEKRMGFRRKVEGEVGVEAEGMGQRQEGAGR